MTWSLRARLNEDECAARSAASFGDAFVPSHAPDCLYGTSKTPEVAAYDRPVDVGLLSRAPGALCRMERAPVPRAHPALPRPARRRTAPGAP
jgi:hypothetical protein